MIGTGGICISENWMGWIKEPKQAGCLAWGSGRKVPLEVWVLKNSRPVKNISRKWCLGNAELSDLQWSWSSRRVKAT